jgi:hypothetical protein
VRKRLVITLAVAAVAALTIIPSATSDTNRAAAVQRNLEPRLGDFVYPVGLNVYCQYRRFADGRQLGCTHVDDNKTIVVWMLNGRLEVYDGDRRIYTHRW